jgi:hypothetical protein
MLYVIYVCQLFIFTDLVQSTANEVRSFQSRVHKQMKYETVIKGVRWREK